jgi:hypothetical protein
MRDITGRPNGTNGTVRKWILLQAMTEFGVTTQGLMREFEMELHTASSHLRKLRASGLLEADGEKLGESHAIRSIITNAGRDYLAANGLLAQPVFDDSALCAALGIGRPKTGEESRP